MEMIYSSNNNTKGRLGNAIMRIMSLHGIAQEMNTPWAIPTWKYAKYFENDIPQRDNLHIGEKYKEPFYHYGMDEIAKLDFSKTIDFNGYFQSPKYWKEKLRFTDEFRLKCVNKLSIENVEDNQAIAISVRRGDFVGNSAYLQLTPMYYIGALITHFPRWKESQLVFFSDDIEYCKIHFSCLPNAVFAEGLSDIEQLCLMTQCTDYIISNSTFSYCGAYLSEWGEAGKVIRPVKNMAGDHAVRNDEKDYWPDGWTIFDHRNFKLDLKDVTFTIPVKLDHEDRRKNLNLSLCLLQRDFNANYIVGEQGGNKFEYIGKWAKYITYPYDQFHRTKMLNEMAKVADTPIIVNWDADMICPPLQLYLAVEAIRNGADMVYPYDGSFARVPRQQWFRPIEKHLDIGIVGATQFNGKRGGPMPTSSVGGAVLFKKQSFIEGGMENEYMISYAPEDCERYDRFNMLGFDVRRVPGTIYHMDHFIGIDSTSRQPLFKENKAELEKIRSMTKAQLWEYVSTWPWLGEYNNAYFESISPESIESAKEVYKVLSEWGILIKRVVDVGCGIGHWGVDCPGEYYGIDYGIPKQKFLPANGRFIEKDLSKLGEEITFAELVLPEMDLVLCLEVAEHLPESKANELVEFLCSLGDTILFSAAIPYQGGVGHINEQWQSYWGNKFAAQGFGINRDMINTPQDEFQEAIRGNEKIAVWYRQNMVIYKRYWHGIPTDYVHPEMWMNVAGRRATV
jgi:2-polyprenyl-3-methyl-5-hydroxy-6-metoxy-1,4-benzoquinol methylase